MKQIEIPEDMQLILQRAFFEFSRTCSNFVFLLTDAIESGDVNFLHSRIAKELAIKLEDRLVDRDFLTASVFTVLTGLLPAEAEFIYDTSFNVLSYKEFE